MTRHGFPGEATKGCYGDGMGAATDSMSVAALRAEAQRLLRLADQREAGECTGLAAAWCPLHGDCRCPDRSSAMDDPGCPLHAPDSTHAD